MRVVRSRSCTGNLAYAMQVAFSTKHKTRCDNHALTLKHTDRPTLAPPPSRRQRSLSTQLRGGKAVLMAPCLPRICCTRASSCSRVIRSADAEEGAPPCRRSPKLDDDGSPLGGGVDIEPPELSGGAMPFATSCAYDDEAESGSWGGTAIRDSRSSMAASLAGLHVLAMPSGRTGGISPPRPELIEPRTSAAPGVRPEELPACEV
eukprot:scaffold188799_cov31-Tisochrysis_lutea.AAC.1